MPKKSKTKKKTTKKSTGAKRQVSEATVAAKKVSRDLSRVLYSYLPKGSASTFRKNVKAFGVPKSFIVTALVDRFNAKPSILMNGGKATKKRLQEMYESYRAANKAKHKKSTVAIQQ